MRYHFPNSTLPFAAGLTIYLSTVKLLIALGADIDLKDKYGTTALHSAVVSSHLDVIEYLLVKGANTSIKNYRKLTALDYSKHSPAIRALVKRSKKPQP
jgi:ankyrin repeat protein